MPVLNNDIFAVITQTSQLIYKYLFQGEAHPLAVNAGAKDDDDVLVVGHPVDLTVEQQRRRAYDDTSEPDQHADPHKARKTAHDLRPPHAARQQQSAEQAGQNDTQIKVGSQRNDKGVAKQYGPQRDRNGAQDG